MKPCLQALVTAGKRELPVNFLVHFLVNFLVSCRYQWGSPSHPHPALDSFLVLFPDTWCQDADGGWGLFLVGCVVQQHVQIQMLHIQIATQMLDDDCSIWGRHRELHNAASCVTCYLSIAMQQAASWYSQHQLAATITTLLFEHCNASCCIRVQSASACSNHQHLVATW
jgi:hypothetical protein